MSSLLICDSPTPNPSPPRKSAGGGELKRSMLGQRVEGQRIPASPHREERTRAPSREPCCGT